MDDRSLFVAPPLPTLRANCWPVVFIGVKTWHICHRRFDFRVKPRFPKKLTPEFLFVDLLNNLDELAEDRDAVLQQARSKLKSYDPVRLQRAVESFGSMAVRKRLREWVGS